VPSTRRIEFWSDEGQGNGNYKDGYFTAEAIAERRWAKSMVGAFTEKSDC
jgi:hypothetical protein